MKRFLSGLCVLGMSIGMVACSGSAPDEGSGAGPGPTHGPTPVVNSPVGKWKPISFRDRGGIVTDLDGKDARVFQFITEKNVDLTYPASVAQMQSGYKDLLSAESFQATRALLVVTDEILLEIPNKVFQDAHRVFFAAEGEFAEAPAKCMANPDRSTVAACMHLAGEKYAQSEAVYRLAISEFLKSAGSNFYGSSLNNILLFAGFQTRFTEEEKFQAWKNRYTEGVNKFVAMKARVAKTTDFFEKLPPSVTDIKISASFILSPNPTAAAEFVAAVKPGSLKAVGQDGTVVEISKILETQDLFGIHRFPAMGKVVMSARGDMMTIETEFGSLTLSRQ